MPKGALPSYADRRPRWLRWRPARAMTEWRSVSTAELERKLEAMRAELRVATANAAQVAGDGDVWALAERAAAGELRRVVKAIRAELKRRAHWRAWRAPEAVLAGGPLAAQAPRFSNRSWVRFQSRSFVVARLSRCRLPRPKATSHFTRLSFQ